MAPQSSSHVSAGDRAIILSSIAALTILAWIDLLHSSREMSAAMTYDTMMAEMGMSASQAWTPADALVTFSMWAVMMVGMMTASAAPVLLVVARSAAARGERRLPISALVFAAGYFVVWTGFSGVATLAQWALHRAAMLSPAMATTSPRVGGAILIVAGLYQVTPLKRACLVHCRSPIDFLMTHWRSGLGGSFRMGVHHGAYCLGCCWALMAVLFVVGIMNLVSVAGIGAFVLLEKTGRAGLVLSRFAGAGLVAAGLILVFRPG